MSWTAPAFLDEFAERLEERSGLSGVKVYTSPVDSFDAEESIVLVRVEGDQEWSALGGQSREDKYTVQASILIARAGAGEQIAKTARDRGKELLDEIETDIRELMSSNNVHTFATSIGATNLVGLNLSRINLSQGANADGERWTQIDFDIEVKARI